MSECVVRMEMPRVCITENGYYGYCPMDRVWCIQRNAPLDITMREAYEAMTDKIPSWCPIICQLSEGHGRLVDADALERNMFAYAAPEMLWDRDDIEHKIGEMPSIVSATEGEKK